MGRSPRCSKDGLNKGAWTALEDKILTDYVKTHGEGKWSNLAKETGIKRCGKSCRLRWLNYLRPDIKRGSILADEEELIIRLHKLLGNRWSLIAGRLPGRTDNEIKNYWNSYLAKKTKYRQFPSVSSNTDKKPIIIHNEAEAEQRNGAYVTPQKHTEDQNHDDKVATRPSMDTNLVKNKSKPLESSAGSPASMSPKENASDFIFDLSSEDFDKMFDLDFTKLSDIDKNELNNAIEGDGGTLLLTSEEMENNRGDIEYGQPNDMVSDFQRLFLESNDGWLGDEEELIIRLHKLIGNRWSLIAGRLPGRTDNEIKNYWNSYLAKAAKYHQFPSVRSNTDKNPIIIYNEAEAVQCKGAYVNPQNHTEDQNNDDKVATRPSMDTHLVKIKSEFSKSCAGSPSSITPEENASDFIFDLSSEDWGKMFDLDFAKLSGSECGDQPNNMVSDFQPLLLESNDGWLGDDMDVLFSD